MEPTRFVQPGTLLKPGPIGRTVRLLLGLLFCYGALRYGESPGVFTRIDAPPLVLFAGPAVAFWLLPPVVNLGWGVNWKNRSRVYFLVLSALAAGLDLLFYRGFWGPPLGGLVYAVTVYTFVHLGLSFLLAAVLSTPGCEMRAIPDLIGRLTGRRALEHHCPGALTPLDNWELKRR